MRPRHVPMRSCAGCRQQRPKREMIRVVRATDGSVGVDPTGKQNGRGTYLCPDGSCWDRALRSGSLGRALKVPIGPPVRQELERFIQELAAGGRRT
jgi:predicted RNA-binding protein YlxR (DUF448 family)